MKITREDVSPTLIKLTVALNAAELKHAKEHAVSKLGKDVKVAGFRSGKAPANLVEKSIDQALLQAEVVDHAIQDAYVKALEKEAVRPVLQPKVSLVKFVPYTDLECSIEAEVLGKIVPYDYKKLTKKRPKATITDKDVEDVLQNMRLQLAEKAEVKRAAKSGDEAWIDFSGKDESGKPVNGADGKDYPLALGSNTFIPGFEDNLIGLKAGDKKTFQLTFPKDYGVAALKNRKVEFKVKVKQVKEVKLPELNEEFVKKVSPVKTVKELKADIKKQVGAERQRQSDNDFDAEIINDLTAKSKVELPAGLLEEQIMAVLTDLKQNLAYRGLTYQEYLDNAGMQEDEHREQELLPEAERRLKAGLVLSEIADNEKLTVSEDEINGRLSALKLQHQNDPQMAAELDKPENRRDIAARLLTEKTIKLVTEAIAPKA